MNCYRYDILSNFKLIMRAFSSLFLSAHFTKNSHLPQIIAGEQCEARSVCGVGVCVTLRYGAVATGIGLS